jgi:hypothetical protein
MIVLSDTAKMKLDDIGVVPGIGLTTRNGLPFAVLHLTRGSRAIIAGNTVQGAGAGALKFSASVDGIMEKGDSTTDWEFNFIQLLYQPVQMFHYAGFHPSDGSMLLNVTEPVPQYRLDSDAARAPYPVSDAANAVPMPVPAKPPRDIRDSPPDKQFSNKFEDHPNVANLFLVNKNYLTGVDNYLIRATVQRHFLTAFVAKDKLNRRSSDYVILSYIAWMVIWDGIFFWLTRRKIVNSIVQRKVYIAEPPQTTHPPRALAGLIERPTTNASNMFSEINFTSFNNAFNATADSHYCTASAKWPQGEIILMIDA